MHAPANEVEPETTRSHHATPPAAQSVATFFAILVKIGPLQIGPEISLPGVSVSFRTRRQKSTYHIPNISASKTGPKHHKLFSIGRLLYADYKTEITFEETLL